MKLFIGTLAILLTAFGLQKLADKLDTTIKGKAVESERAVASNGGMTPKAGKNGGKGGDKGKIKA